MCFSFPVFLMFCDGFSDSSGTYHPQTCFALTDRLVDHIRCKEEWARKDSGKASSFRTHNGVLKRGIGLVMSREKKWKTNMEPRNVQFDHVGTLIFYLRCAVGFCGI